MTITIHATGDENDFPIKIELEDYSMLSWLIGAIAPGSKIVIPKGTIHASAEIEILVKEPVE